MTASGPAASQAAKLIDTAAAAMRRKINIFTSSRGQAGSNGVRWTRAEAIVLIESIIEEAVFTEAAESGTTASDLHALTNLLATMPSRTSSGKIQEASRKSASTSPRTRWRSS